MHWPPQRDSGADVSSISPSSDSLCTAAHSPQKKSAAVHRLFIGANRGIVGCMWLIYRNVELRYWLDGAWQCEKQQNKFIVE